jgi:hypothetical protein
LEEYEFQVIFEPQQLGYYSCYLLLVLDDIPKPRTLNHPYCNYMSIDYEAMKSFLTDIHIQYDPGQFFHTYEEHESIIAKKVDIMNDEKKRISLACAYIKLIGVCTKRDNELNCLE